MTLRSLAIITSQIRINSMLSFSVRDIPGREQACSAVDADDDESVQL